MEKQERLAPERAPFEHLPPGGKRFTHEGIECYVVMGPVSINGYIRLPDDHPWLDYPDSLECHPGITVHGGITYQQDQVIGFDTAHAGDAWHPQSESAKRTPEFHRGYGHVWEEPEVIEETKRLADQAVAEQHKTTVSSDEKVADDQPEHPKWLHDLEDYDDAPTFTIICAPGDAPGIKRTDGRWSFVGIDVHFNAIDIVEGGGAPMEVLRWGRGE